MAQVVTKLNAQLLGKATQRIPNEWVMHRNLTIQQKLILINYTTTVDDFNKKLTINTNIQQNYKHVYRAYTTIE